MLLNPVCILLSMCHLQKVHAQGPLAVADQENVNNDQDSNASGKYFARTRNEFKLYVHTGRELWNLEEEGGETQLNRRVVVE